MSAEKEPVAAPPGAVLIDDGYSLSGVLQDDESRLPPVTIVYRPALPEVVLDYRNRDRDTGDKAKAAMIDLLAPRITSWSGVFRRDPSGNFVPVDYTRERLGQLPQPYLDKAVEYVCGYRPGRWDADAKN